MTRRLPIALLAAALLTGLPGVARADGDPASDVLLRQDAYYPYDPPTAPVLSRALDRLLSSARRAGYPMKVALIATPADLGAYPNMYGQQQAYAALLARELQTLRHGTTGPGQLHLLVLTRSGFSGSGLGDHVDAALAPVQIPPDARSGALAQAAMKAVVRIATSNGHALRAPPEATIALPQEPAAKGRPTSGGSPSPLVFALPALLVVLGAFVAARLAARRATVDEDQPPSAPSG